MRLTTKHNNFKKHLWETLNKKANVIVKENGDVVRIDVSGPTAHERVVAQIL